MEKMIIPAQPGYFIVSKYSDNGPRLYLTPIVAWGVRMTGGGWTSTKSLAFLSTVHPIAIDGSERRSSSECAIRFPDGRTVVHGMTFEPRQGEELLNYMDSYTYEWKGRT
jgi:hypothetical protein